MTPRQKHAAAVLLFRAAGDALDLLEEVRSELREGYDYHRDLDGLSHDEIAAQLAMWLRGLPGTEWDSRLPTPWAE
jgi:hypothetical protein